MSGEKKRAIYPGSFDPITFGHVDIALRSLKIFDELIISIGDNRNKQPLFSKEQRIAQINEIFSDNEAIRVVSFDGLLVDLARGMNIFTIIRGLRAVSDFEYEFQLSSFNRKMEPRVESFFMMTSEKYFYISSSMVRQVSEMNGDISDFVPPNVLADLKSRQKRS
ncbi:MAG TPA: pantetheine-phosphate adenylyltransferase [bacterium]|nr:pantetheine-phosphate adenylyltransferase [bacterium]